MRKVIMPIVVAVILAGSFVFVANMASDTAISIKNKGYVKVKGFAKKEIKSDLAILEARIVRKNEDLQTCYKGLRDDRKSVDEFFKSSGISKEKVEFLSAEINEKYKVNERGYATSEFAYFKLSQKFKLELNDVGKIADLSERLSGLLDKGVALFISEPNYIFSKLDDLKVQMIGEATANAKERAEIIAKKGKFRLGPIASVRVGVFQITPLHSTKVSNYGINDTSSIDKEIKSVVEIQYFVK